VKLEDTFESGAGAPCDACSLVSLPWLVMDASLVPLPALGRVRRVDRVRLLGLLATLVALDQDVLAFTATATATHDDLENGCVAHRAVGDSVTTGDGHVGRGVGDPVRAVLDDTQVVPVDDLAAGVDLATCRLVNNLRYRISALVQLLDREPGIGVEDDSFEEAVELADGGIATCIRLTTMYSMGVQLPSSPVARWP